MIKHTLTKKQQLVLCAMYVESLSGRPLWTARDSWNVPAVKCIDGSVRIFCDETCDCSIYTMRYLEDYGLAGWHPEGGWTLTPDGEEMAKALLKVLS